MKKGDRVMHATYGSGEVFEVSKIGFTDIHLDTPFKNKDGKMVTSSIVPTSSLRKMSESLESTNRQDLIKTLKQISESSPNDAVLYLSKQQATDLLRELEGEAPTCKCGNKKVLQYACEQCDN